jgi:hypothetical protein
MNAKEVFKLCKFDGSLRPIKLKDAEEGRIQIWSETERLGTICPGRHLRTNDDVVVLDINNDHEFRSSWEELPIIVSALQESWDEVYESMESAHAERLRLAQIGLIPRELRVDRESEVCVMVKVTAEVLLRSLFVELNEQGYNARQVSELIEAIQRDSAAWQSIDAR